MRFLKKNEKGFIFIDALIGMVILTIALTALAVAYRQLTVTTVAARDYNNAVYLAQQAAETLKINDGKKENEETEEMWTIADKTTTIDKVSYEVTTQIADVNSLKQATITVSWLNHSKSISIVSYYYLIP